MANEGKLVNGMISQTKKNTKPKVTPKAEPSKPEVKKDAK